MRSDIDLLRIAAGADACAEEAFATLYRRHRDFAFRVARRFARDDAEAMDAVQEAFVYLVRNAERLARPGALTGRLTTLLYPVIKNSALALTRKSRRLRFVDAVPSRGATAAPAPMTDASERTRRLAEALEALPEAQREVLFMRVVDGMSVSEVAAALGVSEGTVKSRLFYAMGTLRDDPRARSWLDGP